MGCGLDSRRSIAGRGKKISSPHRRDRLSDPPSFLANGYWEALSPGVKQPGSEAGHSPSRAEIKNNGVILRLPHPHVFMGRSLIKHRDKFTFTVYV
jgi:hypothetical protein